MALPKLNTPSHRLVLPSTGEEIKFRPFLVKEQKILLMATENGNENEIIDSVTKVIQNCTGLDATELPVFDVEYLFLKIRAKSVGDIVNVGVQCPDDETTTARVTVDLNEVEVLSNNDHKDIVDITDDIKIYMRYPNISDVKLGKDITTEVDTVFELLKKCIVKIENGEEIINRVDFKTQELVEFIESLNAEQFDNVLKFFNTMPKVRHVIEVTNPKTKVKSEVLLEGLQSFLD